MQNVKFAKSTQEQFVAQTYIIVFFLSEQVLGTREQETSISLYFLIYLDLIYLRNILEILLNLLVTNLVILQISIEIALVGWHINQAMT